jgi:predicted PurR-regulated permease PerM
VVRKVIGIPPVLVILALIIGAKVAGFLGIILSVPITAILMEFISDVAKEKKIFED